MHNAIHRNVFYEEDTYYFHRSGVKHKNMKEYIPHVSSFPTVDGRNPAPPGMYETL